MLFNSTSVLTSLLLAHVIQFSISCDLICTGSSYHPIRNENQLNTLCSNIIIHSYVSQSVCGNSVSYDAIQDLWKASLQPSHSVSHLRVSQCHPLPHIIWRFHKFLWIGNRTRSLGAVIPVNPRANGSAGAGDGAGWYGSAYCCQSVSKTSLFSGFGFYFHHHVQTPHPIALGRSQFTVEVFLRTY